jgi:beta-mannosidase
METKFTDNNTLINFKAILVKAKVAGSIYSDLRTNNVLKQDLYYGYNDVNYRWVSYDNWTYERNFEGLVNFE